LCVSYIFVWRSIIFIKYNNIKIIIDIKLFMLFIIIENNGFVERSKILTRYRSEK